MKYYKITLSERISRVATHELEAGSEEQAIEKARKYILDNPDEWTEFDSDGIDEVVLELE